MIDESALRDTLILLASYQKKMLEMVIETLNETASIRETVRALDPAFEEVLSQKRGYYKQADSEQIHQLLGDYDSMIQKLKGREVC